MLVGALSLTAFANTSKKTATGSDSMGMMAAFMGTTEVTDGEYTAPASNAGAAITSSTITAIINNNVTISTPYSYR